MGRHTDAVVSKFWLGIAAAAEEIERVRTVRELRRERGLTNNLARGVARLARERDFARSKPITVSALAGETGVGRSSLSLWLGGAPRNKSEAARIREAIVAWALKLGADLSEHDDTEMVVALKRHLGLTMRAK